MSTPGPWFVEPIDDTNKYNLPHGTIYQVLASIDGYPATICTIEEYREISRPLDRAGDAAMIACAPDMRAALLMIAGLAESAMTPHTLGNIVKLARDTLGVIEQAELASKEQDHE